MENNNVNEKNIQKPKSNKKVKQRARIALLVIIHVIAVSSIIGLSVALAYSEQNYMNALKYRNDMEYYYMRTYYDLTDQVNELEVNMKKLSVSDMPECQQPLLFSIWSGAKSVSNGMSGFTANDENFMKAQKFVNQLGEYCYSLAIDMHGEEGLNTEQKSKFEQLSKFLGVMKESIGKMEQNISAGKTFLDKDGILNGISDTFGNFNNSALEYPEMIYDGPFSDALEEQTPKGLKGENINSKQGKTKVSAMFKSSKISDVQFLGETKSRFSNLNYSFMINGKRAIVQLTKKGGNLLGYDLENTGGAANKSLDCVEVAKKFAENAGYSDLTEVWSQYSDGICFVNLAPVQDGVILYPDLIKIKLDANTKEVTGFDAVHYLTNHTTRILDTPAISEGEARSKIKLNNIMPGKLTLIPFMETKEILTYEFRGESDGVYYIYINALTGKEQNILYVVDTPNGKAVQ